MLTNGLIQALDVTQRLTKAQKELALQHWQNNPNRSCIPYLSKNFNLSTHEIALSCAEFFDLPMCDLNNYNIVKDNVNNEIINKATILPLQKKQSHMQVAISDPCYFNELMTLEVQLNCNIVPIIVDHKQLHHIFTTLRNKKQNATINDNKNIKNNNDNDTQQLVNKIFNDAVHCDASDIHFETQKDQLKIRLRIDGLLHQRNKLTIEISPATISHLKILANLDIAEKRLPQDGRFNFHANNGSIRDCRLNSCPTIHGEKIVVRLLNPLQQILSIDQLGLNKKAQQLFLEIIKKPQGLILVTGPTGSGKSITLYTLLNILNNEKRNVITIEDPVEMQLDGLNQVNINYAAGLDFATALRAFLRQDPDVIMVGEIRDRETAEIAIHAAQTGHLVLATLHTNSAPEAVIRLINMGVAPFNIISSINLIVAQRLVRKLCKFCKNGCEHCVNGYKGRTGVFSLMPMTQPLNDIILNDCNIDKLNKQAQQDSMQTLWQAAQHKVDGGVTSLEEIYRVVGGAEVFRKYL